jgi:hypothetical protein
VRDIIDKVPRIDAERGTDHVFTSTGKGPLNNWSRFKLKLDQKMLEIMKRESDDPNSVTLVPWQFRDLRRTARTIFARLSIVKEVAEHCIAHAQPEMVETYNVYQYPKEKREAFKKLADHIASIVSKPPTDNNVHQLRAV